MRRTFGYIAFVVGVVLVVLSPLLRWYAYPRVAKAPTDVYDTSQTIGSGAYFNPATLSQATSNRIVNESTAKGEPEKSTVDIAVIGIVSRTYDTTTGVVLSYGDDLYAMDRVTGYAVHCCGEFPRHEGLTLKFPFDTEKRTYLFYDSTALKAFPATYQRTDEVDGLKTYVFVSQVPKTLVGGVGFPGKLGGHPDLPSVATFRYYEATTTLWVEPLTGAIIKVTQHNRQWITDATGVTESTLADLTFHSSQADINDTGGQIKTKYGQLELVRNILPIFGPIAGLILIVVGVLLLLRRRPASPGVAPAATAPAEAGA